MSFPRVRFTVRRMVVAVATIVAILCAETMRQRGATQQLRDRYLLRAETSRMLSREFRIAYETKSGNVFTIPHGPVIAATPALRLIWAQHYECLASKYELAASRPWEPVPPEPPPPEVVSPAGNL
jgi:hypothetical protein